MEQDKRTHSEIRNTLLDQTFYTNAAPSLIVKVFEKTKNQNPTLQVKQCSMRPTYTWIVQWNLGNLNLRGTKTVSSNAKFKLPGVSSLETDRMGPACYSLNYPRVWIRRVWINEIPLYKETTYNLLTAKSSKQVLHNFRVVSLPGRCGLSIRIHI